jgi:hypothetical protein
LVQKQRFFKVISLELHDVDEKRNSALVAEVFPRMKKLDGGKMVEIPPDAQVQPKMAHEATMETVREVRKVFVRWTGQDKVLEDSITLSIGDGFRVDRLEGNGKTGEDGSFELLRTYEQPYTIRTDCPCLKIELSPSLEKAMDHLANPLLHALSHIVLKASPFLVLGTENDGVESITDNFLILSDLSHFGNGMSQGIYENFEQLVKHGKAICSGCSHCAGNKLLPCVFCSALKNCQSGVQTEVLKQFEIVNLNFF